MTEEITRPHFSEVASAFSNHHIGPAWKQLPSFSYTPISASNTGGVPTLYNNLSQAHAMLRRCGHYYGELLLENPRSSSPIEEEEFLRKFEEYGLSPEVTLHFRNVQNENTPAQEITIANKKITTVLLSGPGSELTLAQALFLLGEASNYIVGDSQEERRVDTLLGSIGQASEIPDNMERAYTHLHSALRAQGIDPTQTTSMMQNAGLDIEANIAEQLINSISSRRSAVTRR